MSHKAKYINGKLAGWIPAGRQAPDYQTIFPSTLSIPEYMRDEYGNLCYELQGGGTEKAEFVKVDVSPTEEQVSAVRKQQIVREMQKAGYDINTEIALLKDAVKAVSAGQDLPSEFVAMEAKREDIKTKDNQDGAIRRDL